MEPLARVVAEVQATEHGLEVPIVQEQEQPVLGIAVGNPATIIILVGVVALAVRALMETIGLMAVLAYPMQS
jgi:hypothetical protein